VFRYKYWIASGAHTKRISLPENHIDEDDIENRSAIIPPNMESAMILETLMEFPPPTALDKANLEHGMGMHVHVNEQECWSHRHRQALQTPLRYLDCHHSAIISTI
jgi:hypothetical protein